jgi:Spy/CpxP family protein refolding chaperone
MEALHDIEAVLQTRTRTLMKTRTTSTLGIFAALLLLSAPVAAEKEMHHSMGHGEWSGKSNSVMSSHGHGHHKKQCDSRQHGMHAAKGKHGKKSGILRHRDELELTEGQVKQVKALLRENKKATIMLKAEIDVAKIDLKTLKYSDPVDMQASAAAIKNIAAKKADIDIAWLQFKVDSKAVLTEEQKKKLKAIYRSKHNHKS